MHLWHQYAFRTDSVVYSSENFHGKLLSPFGQNCSFVFRDVVLRFLKTYAYHHIHSDIRLSTVIPMYKRLSLFGHKFGSKLWGSGTNSWIMVLWERGEVDKCWFTGQVQFYFSVDVHVNGSVGVPHFFAKVAWCTDESPPSDPLHLRVFSFTGSESKEILQDIIPGLNSCFYVKYV